MEGTRAHGKAAGGVAPARAGSCWPVATATFDARLGQVCDTGDALGDSPDLLIWTTHRRLSCRKGLQGFILCTQEAQTTAPTLLKSPKKRDKERRKAGSIPWCVVPALLRSLSL